MIDIEYKLSRKKCNTLYHIRHGDNLLRIQVVVLGQLGAVLDNGIRGVCLKRKVVFEDNEVVL